MEKEKSGAALARIFDGPSFPFFCIGSTNDSPAGVACVDHSSEVFHHEAPVNVRVFLHEFIYHEARERIEPFFRWFSKQKKASS